MLSDIMRKLLNLVNESDEATVAQPVEEKMEAPVKDKKPAEEPEVDEATRRTRLLRKWGLA